MKFLKKAVSALLASVMCIPSGILSFANATEESTVTTVTLSDTENGFMQFSEDSMKSSTASQDGYHMVQVGDEGELEQVENDGSMWAFNTGDFVEIELIPDNGYNVKSFAIKDSASGDIMASKETMDNIFSFSMPENSVIIEAVFTESDADGFNDKGNGQAVERPDEGTVTDNDIERLQEKIDALPSAGEIYTEFDHEGASAVEDINEESSAIKEEYFEDLSAEQAESVDASKLYSAVLASSICSDDESGEKVPDEGQTIYIQQKIDSLGDIEEIVQPSESNTENYTFLAYGQENTEMLISEEETEQLFLDTLALTEDLQELDHDYVNENLNTTTLIQMQALFTTGYAYAVQPRAGSNFVWYNDNNDNPPGVTYRGVYSQDYGEDPYIVVSGSYASSGHESNGSNNWNMKVTVKNQKTGKTEKMDGKAYCACAAWPRDYYKGSKTVSFDASRVACLTGHNRGGSIVDPYTGNSMNTPAEFKKLLNDKTVTDELVKRDRETEWATHGNAIIMRMVLWYGYDGPGYGKDGMPKPTYEQTHFALSCAYSGQIGGYGACKAGWLDFYKECVRRYVKSDCKTLGDFMKKANISDGKDGTGADVTFESYRVYLICPTNATSRVQHIFFALASSSQMDPLVLVLAKKTNKDKDDPAVPNKATMEGAKYKVDFYEGKSYKTVKSLKGEPTKSWTFTTSAAKNVGGEQYSRYMTWFSLNTESGVPVAGIDFMPENPSDPRNKWVNDFINQSQLASYQKFFGLDGSYHIYESKAPAGFTEGGKMTNTLGSKTVDDSSDGMVIRIKGNIEDSGTQIWVDGEEIKEHESKFFNGEKVLGATLVNTETVPDLKIKSKAAVTGTGSNEASADSGEITIQDTITITPYPDLKATYVTTVKLIDKDSMRGPRIQWILGENDETSLSGLIHTEKSSGDGEKIKFTVKGKIDTTGMANPKPHTLVFVAETVCQSSRGNTTKTTSQDDTAEYIVFEDSEPGITTSISDNGVNRKAGSGEALVRALPNQTVTDKIKYTGFEKDKTYNVRAWLVDASNLSKIPGTDVSVDKVASAQSGTWDVKFTFDASQYAGKTLVSFVEVYDEGTLFFDSKDVSDKQETIRIPAVETDLIDQDTKDHVTTEGKSTLVDTITYKNLLPNTTYRIKTSLVDAATGQVARDANGQPMTVTAEHDTGDAADDSFDVKLKFDIDTSNTKQYVAFEEIYVESGEDGSNNWVLVAEHKDLDDPRQKTTAPQSHTFAVDQKTDEHLSYAEKYVTLFDVVHYEDLEPNKEYTIISTLVDKDTGEMVVDDNGVAQTKQMTFETKENIELGQYIDNKPYKGDLYSDLDGKLSGIMKPDGTFTGKFDGNATYIKEGYAYGDIIPGNHENGGIGFTLNASSFAGRTLVFYEEIYKNTENGPVLVMSEMDPANENQSIHFPKIQTHAIDYDTQSSMSLGGDGTTTIVDTVSYENVIPGFTYKIKGRVIDRNRTMDTQTDVIAVGTDGNPAESEVVFTPDAANGSIQLSFNIDTSRYVDDMKAYKGAAFVVYEDLYVIQRYDGDDAESIVASHEDIFDENQTVYLPYITTTLLDQKTGLHIMYAEKEACLTDTITYSNFKPGETVYISGRLIDMRTGKTLTDSSGKEAKIDYQMETVKQDVYSDVGDDDTPLVKTDTENTWTLTYNLDASALAGTTVVAYAEVYVRGGSNPNQDGYTPVATHDDFFDRNERVYIPYIDTTLLDQKTDSHYALAEKDVVLFDTVHYTDIHPGDYEYKFESELRDQATGEIAVDNAGRELSLTTTFKADFDMRDDQFATYGDVIPQNYEGSGITFKLDGEYFQDRTLVCYERMYVKGADGEWKIVADHQELLDPDQTVHIGKGWTEAIDGTTKTQTGLISKNATIVDTFYYQNLNPEYTYELKGKVVEKKSTIATGTDVVVAENTVSNLRPESSSGTWRNSFTFDATKYNSEEYYGATLVVYEELYQIKRYGASDDRLLIASEQDVNSASQTVWYPHIETELLETTSGTHVMAAGEDRELTDTVSYHNMQPGTSYVLKGWLVDMESGQVLTDSAGKRMEKTVEVMSTDNGDGEWKINYSIDASALSGKLIVAYAEVYIRNGGDTAIFSQVAQHTDFWDSDERVYVPVISTVATDQKTNSHLSFAEDNMWITDRVYYSYLQADSEYRLISTLVDKETGEVVIDDKGIAQRKETTFNTTANASQEKYVQTIANPMTDSSDTGIGYAYGYVVPGDGTVLPDGKKPDGIVFSFDGGTFEGRTLVIYEELQMYNADGTWKTVATHMDLDDENQTIHIPKVRTNAIDSETMTHVSKKDGMVTIIDTVTYENLLPGMTYVIEGVLMDQLRDDEKASMPIKDADGNMITGTVTFTPDKPNGTQRVVFQGNVSDFHTDEGEFSSETLVVFEDLYLLNSKDASDDRLKVAEHRDIDDENQTIYFPRVRTKAVAYGLDGNPKQGDADHVNGYAVYRCSYCKKHFLTEEEAKNHINGTVLCKNKGAKAEAVTEYTLYDTLYYENLIPGRTYQVVGTVIDTATGKAVLKGHTAVQSDTKYFTPGSRSGEVDVVFHMDGPELAGGRYVVYEEIFLNGSSVASHMDINDKDQMFNVIDMKTSAKDQETGTNISAGNTVSTIIDTVEMGPLVENQEYYLKSALMDITKDAAGTKSENYGSYYRDASGEAVQGSAWRVKGTSVWHTMDEPVVGPSYSHTGGMLSVEVKFTVDTITEHGGKNFQGETYVLFEELRLAGGEVVAQHKDLADAQQTIQVGGMYTVAYDKDTGTNIMEAAEGKTLYDTVYYSNLKPSTTYKVTTRIYVKEDSNMEAGEYVEVTPLNATNLVAAAHVTSRSGTGFWTISASMPDLSKYAGKTLVVYEDIVDLDGVQVAVENNLYNESQSIHLPAASTLEADNENGLHFTRAQSKWFCDNDSCVTYTCNGCGEQFHSEDEAKKHLPDCWNRESDGYTCTGGCFDTKAEAEQHTAPVYECDNCGLHFSDKEDAEVHVNGACKDAAVFRATQLVRDADGNVVNELWYACSGLNRLEFAGGRFRSFFCRKISLPHML